MNPIWRRRILRLALGLYLVGMGFFMGVVVERWRFDGARKAMLDRYNEVLRQVHTHQMKIELEEGRQ